MFEGYHKLNNQHALQALSKPIVVPGAALGIGDGETMASLAMRAQYQEKQNYVVIPDITSRSIEQATIDGHGNAVMPTDFPMLNFYGDPIGRI